MAFKALLLSVLAMAFLYSTVNGKIIYKILYFFGFIEMSFLWTSDNKIVVSK